MENIWRSASSFSLFNISEHAPSFSFHLVYIGPDLLCIYSDTHPLRYMHHAFFSHFGVSNSKSSIKAASAHAWDKGQGNAAKRLNHL